ncbi:hypothetical protein M752DRAFT_85203 [Aspergillus phoenicis ATCC 13157]|nr:hypothetical protein M752DRAFT_85203 [Aspergillus phoenicis ATCC 13157]
MTSSERRSRPSLHPPSMIGHTVSAMSCHQDGAWEDSMFNRALSGLRGENTWRHWKPGLDQCEGVWWSYRHNLTRSRTGRLQWCRQHHGFHDPWRYDVKKRPITEEARMPRQPLSRVFRFRFSIFCLFRFSPWDSPPLAQEREKHVKGGPKTT